MGSLKAEAALAGAPVGVHTLSPGMVLTDLLLEGASDANKQARAPAAARARQPRTRRGPGQPVPRDALRASGRAGRPRCWRCARACAWPTRKLAQGVRVPYPDRP